MKFINDINQWLHDGDYTNPNDYPVYICVNNEPRLLGGHETAPKDWDVDGILHPDGSATKIWGPTGITTDQDANWVHDNWPGCSGIYEPVNFSGEEGEEGGGCFAAGTKVLTEGNQLVSIEEIRWAHIVRSVSKKKGPNVYRHVHRVFFAEKQHVVEVRFHGDPRPLYVTPRHRIYTDNNWVPIGLCSIGQRVLRCSNAERLEVDRIESIIHIKEPRTVYNISVLGTQCYFAEGILVHNLKKNTVGDFPGTDERFG